MNKIGHIDWTRNKSVEVAWGTWINKLHLAEMSTCLGNCKWVYFTKYPMKCRYDVDIIHIHRIFSTVYPNSGRYDDFAWTEWNFQLYCHHGLRDLL